MTRKHATAPLEDVALPGPNEADPTLTRPPNFGGLSKFEPAVQLECLVESEKNPRKRFDPASMAELEASIREKGVLTPLLARPLSAGPHFVYEIASGHRRFRAAKAVGVPHVPVLVREMSDAEFLEVLVVENDQRVDVHALEEAGGYKELLRLPGYDVARIAARVGRSPKYVYDRLKLLQLIPAAQKLFLEDRFTAGHAILLARLKEADQERAIAIDGEATGYGNHPTLFTPARSLPFADEEIEELEESDPYALMKPVSVREFEAWIQRNVKFDRAAADPMLFPETAELLEQAELDKLKVIPITREYLASDAVRRSANGERIFGEQAWKRADGKEGSKACRSDRVGLVACGPGQGEAFRVCVAKEKCALHWGAWQRERQKRQSAAAKGDVSRVEADRRQREQQESLDRAEKEQQERWKKAVRAMNVALAAAVKKAPAGASGLLADCLVKQASVGPGAGALVPRGKTAEDLVRHLAFGRLVIPSTTWDLHGHRRKHFTVVLKAFGIDAGKILDEVAPVQTSATPAGKAKRGTRRKCGRLHR